MLHNLTIAVREITHTCICNLKQTSKIYVQQDCLKVWRVQQDHEMLYHS